ncbi:hypothetical protein J2T13_004962 [Paenibacillus sp. DS2015]|uniref:hypothetical protein n=1 Tax=Paenibacillus sp. DS2015 TaxID=3373917 RepID=UPI003D199C7E
MLQGYKVRIIANACITRYENGERAMDSIVGYYNQTEEITKSIKEEILIRVPTMDFEATE